jgi:tetratricopeptide (TPR) repeat protein
MKTCLLACLLSCMALTHTFAQTRIDPNLKFDQPFTKCELKWIVLPPRPNTPNAQYGYGLVYIDMMAGYTFDLKGTFKVDDNGHYIIDTSMTRYKSYKIRLGSNTIKFVALLPQSHFAEMHIQPRPAWVDIYYRGRDTTTTAYNYRMGFILNGAGDSKAALPYLDKAYRADPEFKGLIFEVAYACNALARYDDAIKYLKEALKNDPKNPMLYRELGYAYKLKGANDDAISYYKQGIDLCGAGQSDSKAEMGYNLAYIYKAKGDDADFKDMIAKVKTWVSPTSDIYKMIVQAGL